MTVLYSAMVTSSGDGRNGTVRSSDEILNLALTSPRELGGSGEATNPEQLFAAGYAACFHSALRMAAREASVKLSDDTVDATVDLVKDTGGFHLAVQLTTFLPKLPQDMADTLVRQAHQRCPYSKAIAGNVTVQLHTKV
jgi:osmotically inducible protein OsmC